MVECRDKLNAAEKFLLSEQVLTASGSDNLNSNYTVDANGVANVSTYGQFSKAFVDKKVSTINLTGDIDFTNLQEIKIPIIGTITSEDADISDGLWTGEISGNYHMTVLKPYELATKDFKDDRSLTIEGNNHNLNMDKWFISLFNNSNKWNLTLKDLTINSDGAQGGTAYSQFHFYQNATAVLGAKGGSITYDNVTANVKNGAFITYDKETNAATQLPINVTFKGTNNINL